MKKFYRGVVYCIGLIILALGIILNTKTGLGVSPIISIPYCISSIWNINLGTATLFVYTICVFIQIILLRKKFRPFGLLQIPMSVVFGWLINIFNNMITIKCTSLMAKLLLLVLAIMLTGIGAAISVQMKVVPNAADGLAQAVAESRKIELGFGKNIVDICCVIITVVIGLLFAKRVIGIGIGTLAAVLGVGRFIALFNMLFKKRMLALAS